MFGTLQHGKQVAEMIESLVGVPKCGYPVSDDPSSANSTDTGSFLGNDSMSKPVTFRKAQGEGPDDRGVAGEHGEAAGADHGDRVVGAEGEGSGGGVCSFGE